MKPTRRDICKIAFVVCMGELMSALVFSLISCLAFWFARDMLVGTLAGFFAFYRLDKWQKMFYEELERRDKNGFT